MEKDLSVRGSKQRPKYHLPSLDLIKPALIRETRDSNEITKELKDKGDKLISTLGSFGVRANIVNITKGPSVTRYEIQPEPGIKVSRVVSLSDDIALSLASTGVRMEAPIPGKSAIGVEVPNSEIDTVYLYDVIGSSKFAKAPSKISIALGKDIGGNVIIGDISRMPHLLIAGSTGSGKSVCINTIISSVLYKASPEEVRLIMIDPKVVELGVYNGIPHLLIPVITNPKKAASALAWAVQEVERRYDMFASKGVRDILSYNKYLESKSLKEDQLPQIVIIIDELADLMMMSAHDIEDSVIRIAQKARAAGLHLIVATQRPSVNVITGLIKANIPSRIAFAVASQVDARTILDNAGAEKLLGRGDMLYHPLGISKPIRVQGAFVSDGDVEKLVNFIKSRYGEADYDETVMDIVEGEETKENGILDVSDADEELVNEAVELAFAHNQLSASFLQRRLKVGYARAARIIDILEDAGLISPADGSKPRELILTKEEWESR